MSWTDDQWAQLLSLLEHGFAASEPFTPAAANAYRVLMDGIEPEPAIAAVRQLVHQGQTFRPKPGEIAALARRDAGAPTFDEAYELIFGRGGALHARPAGPQVFHGSHADAQRAMQQSKRDAVLERASGMHPLIRSFVELQGVERLLQLPIADPDYGELRRAELRDAWDRHVQAGDVRQVAALASGTDPRRLDPLAALGIRPVPALEEATRS